MNIDIKKVKIFVTIPTESLEAVRNAVCDAGAGIIGNYSYCTFSGEGIGTFVPNEKANAYIGESGKLEFVKEIKLEFICDLSVVRSVLKALRDAHPYEEPAIDIVPLIDENDL